MGTRGPRTAANGANDQRTATGDATRLRLMTAAEKLISRKGIDAVSIRDITDAAKANGASIHYHFGSKRGLIEALLARWAGEVVARRAAVLDGIEERERAGIAPTIRDVAEVMVRPMVDLGGARRSGGGYVGFLAAVMNHPEFIPLMNDLYEPDIVRTLALMERVTPKLSPDVRMLRWAIAKDTVNRAVSTQTSPVHLWLQHYAPHAGDNLGDRLVDFLEGAFAADSTA